MLAVPIAMVPEQELALPKEDDVWEGSGVGVVPRPVSGAAHKLHFLAPPAAETGKYKINKKFSRTCFLLR